MKRKYEDTEEHMSEQCQGGSLTDFGLRESKNPVMLLDEIDKVSTDYKGDTFSALLEVLDNEQNHKFRDHYLEVPLDLSEVLFITTANTLQTIPRPLLDRMEVIEISSYTENENSILAEEHLIPKQIEKHGLTPKQITFSKHSIWKIARNYTKEAGVRQLEREIGNVCRKAAKEIFTTERKKICSDRPKYPSFSRKREVYLSDGKYRCGSRNCPGTCMDKRRRRYASDRSQCNAGKRRTYAYGAARRCDERICQDGDQLYPFGK